MNEWSTLWRALTRVAGSVVLLFVCGWLRDLDRAVSTDDAPLRQRAVSEARGKARVSGSRSRRRRQQAHDRRRHRQQQHSAALDRGSRTIHRKRYALLHSGTDPDYFSPLEVAWSMHTLLGGATNADIDSHLNKLGFKNPVPAGETRSGFLFANPDRQIKLVQHRSFRKQNTDSFLAVSYPYRDDAADPRFALTPFQYQQAAFTDYHDLASLRAALERMPRCATRARMARPKAIL